MRRLRQVLADDDLIDGAIDHAYERLIERDEGQQSELAAVRRKLAEKRNAMQRYFRAFESGTMPEDTCAPRLADLAEQAKELERRAAEIAALAAAEPLQRASAADLDALRSELHAALEDGAPTRVKTMLQALTDEVRIDARDAIEPIFRVPAVRPPSRSVPPTGFEPVLPP